MLAWFIYSNATFYIFWSTCFGVQRNHMVAILMSLLTAPLFTLISCYLLLVTDSLQQEHPKKLPKQTHSGIQQISQRIAAALWAAVQNRSTGQRHPRSRTQSPTQRTIIQTESMDWTQSSQWISNTARNWHGRKSTSLTAMKRSTTPKQSNSKQSR